MWYERKRENYNVSFVLMVKFRIKMVYILLKLDEINKL